MTVIHSDGSRTTGESEQNILIAGLSWRGSVPAGMTLVKSRRTWRSLLDEYTRRVHRRIYCRYTRSSGNSHLVPLSAHGKPYTPPPPGQTGGLFTPNEIVRNVIAQMSTADYFSFMTDDEENPPVLPQDAPIVAKMATIGIVAGQPFNMSQLSPEIRLTTQGYGEQNFIADKSTAAGRAENRHVFVSLTETVSSHQPRFKHMGTHWNVRNDKWRGRNPLPMLPISSRLASARRLGFSR